MPVPMTLDEWYDSWIKVCKTHCRDTTKRTYAIQYNRLREELGWRKLSQLNLVVLQDAFNQLATDTMREDCKSLLVDMLNRAVETELLNKNIAFGINTIIDNEEKEEKRILSNEEIDILLKTSKGGQTYAVIVVALVEFTTFICFSSIYIAVRNFFVISVYVPAYIVCRFPKRFINRA